MPKTPKKRKIVKSSQPKASKKLKNYKVGHCKPPREHCFKKGQVANPLGAGAHNHALKKIRALTTNELVEVGSILLNDDVAALQDVVDNPTGHSIVKAWLCSVALRAFREGDAYHLDKILDRILGKVKDRVEHSGPGGAPISLIGANMTREEKEAELKKLDKLEEEAGDD